MRRSAARENYVVHSAATETEFESAQADERRSAVQRAITGWMPQLGTLELSFEDTLFHALDAMAKGVSVLSLRWRRANDGTVLPAAGVYLRPGNYGWNRSGTELGFLAGGNWRSFGPGEALCGIWQARSGAPGATALLRPLAPYWLGSLFGWRWLMSNAQLFGVPFRWANYQREDAGVREQLLQMLSKMGACGYAAFPEGTKVEFLEAGKTSQDNPQVIIQTMADKACDLLILGQELSGQAQAAGLGSGSSDLQGEVRSARLREAASWCADLLNYQLLPPLLEANYGNTDFMPTVLPDMSEEEDSKAMAERDSILISSGVPLPKAWLYERHSVPAPMDGEETVGGGQPAAQPSENAPPPNVAWPSRPWDNVARPSRPWDNVAWPSRPCATRARRPCHVTPTQAGLSVLQPVRQAGQSRASHPWDFHTLKKTTIAASKAPNGHTPSNFFNEGQESGLKEGLKAFPSHAQTPASNPQRVAAIRAERENGVDAGEAAGEVSVSELLKLRDEVEAAIAATLQKNDLADRIGSAASAAAKEAFQKEGEENHG